MVNVLWPHTSDAATGRLEELWNERIADYELCLLGAYHVDPVDVELRRGICYKVLPVPEPSNHQALGRGSPCQFRFSSSATI